MISINDNNSEICRGWLFIGVHALGISGILSILIVFLRMPFLKSIVHNSDKVFDLALVIHVNLSVLVWLCSVSSILISMTMRERSLLSQYSWVTSAVGAILIALSAISRNAVPIKNNYIPVVDNTTFFVGLSLFCIGVLLNALSSVKNTTAITASPVSAGIYGMSAMITSVALCFTTAYSLVRVSSDKLLFYENIFWGAGHLLQGVFSQAFLVVLLLKVENGKFSHPYLLSAVFIINTASIILASMSHIIYPNDFESLALFFTWHMRVAEAVVPLFLFIFTVGNLRALLRSENHYLLYASAMFTYGGVLGILSVHGTVTIPAHYHGCVVGITTAFMGFIYSILPKLGYAPVSQRCGNIQLCLYTVGQALHITGLEVLGGYGALRKVTYLPDTASKVAKHCFSTGGALAVIGGFLFVSLTLICIYRGRKS